MTVIEIVHTHPFAAGVAVGMLLTFCSLALCALFLYSLEKMKAMARESAKAMSGNQAHQIVSGSPISSAGSGSVS
jgi:hypothetical protein